MKRPLDVLSEEHFMWATATVLDNGACHRIDPTLESVYLLFQPITA